MLRNTIFTVIVVSLFSLCLAQKSAVPGSYSDFLPRIDCGSSEAHEFSQLIVQLDIKTIEANRAKGEFLIGVTYTDSNASGNFDLSFIDGVLEGIVIGRQNLVGEAFQPYKLELIWNPLESQFQGLITNFNPIRCDDGQTLHEFMFVRLSAARG